MKDIYLILTLQFLMLFPILQKEVVQFLYQ